MYANTETPTSTSPKTWSFIAEHANSRTLPQKQLKAFIHMSFINLYSNIRTPARMCSKTVDPMNE